MVLRVDDELRALIPPLSADEYKQLEDNIKRDGCRDPLCAWNGVIVDGHNRHKICTEHGIDYEVRELEFTDREAVKDWMERNQLGRRNLSPDWQRLIRGRIYNRRKKSQGGDGSNQHKQSGQIGHLAKTAELVAKETGVSERTIRRDAKFAEQVEKDAELMAAVMERKPVKQAIKERRTKEIAAERAEIAEKAHAVKPSDRFVVDCCSIADFAPSKQFDYIITDPPYPKEYLDTYETLAEKACELLKDGGLLVAMAGQSYLDQIYEMMARHLDYYWTACYHTPGQPTPLRQVNVNTTWKPLLMFTKRGDKYKGRIFGDVFKSDGNDKQHHKWGQSISGMFDIVSRICVSGQSICDPFAGAGTTGIAALRHGCTFHGCDIDEQNQKISIARLNEEANRDS